MTIIKPKKLQKGDKVGIISPSEPVCFKNKLKNGIKELEKLGLKVILGKNIFKRHGEYMAGTVKERVDDFHAMIKNRQIKAIFTSLGGFCVNQLLPYIDFPLVKKNPKIILGFSDISVLLNAIYKKTGLVTFHGPSIEFVMPKWDKFTKNYFIRAIFESRPLGKISKLTPWKIIKPGKTTGRLIGGNLTCIRTLIGTEFEPDWKNAIFFWEDWNETSENLDHHLTHLKLAGVFDKIKGMIIGKLSNIKKTEDKYLKNLSFFTVEKIISERTAEYNFPIISRVNFGHNCEQITIPIGIKATIDTSKKLFSIDEAAVKN